MFINIELMIILHSSPVKFHKWTFEEERALTEFLGLAKTSPDYGLSGKDWPGFQQDHKLWKDAAQHIRAHHPTSVRREHMRMLSMLGFDGACHFTLI